MKVDEIRRRFLDYFSQNAHEVVPSAPLIPRDDPTLFFVNAGMVPFKEVFVGREHRRIPRAASAQRCVRVSGKHNDLENVGRTARHHTFFEMLGNFSFGDYFKREAIRLSWAFLTQELGVDPDKLWITVFEDDDEAYDLWLEAGFPEARLQRLGADENFWAMGATGPCGPCSEIYYDHGPDVSDVEGGPATGDDRYVEIWNLVFMQFDQDTQGNRTPLPSPSIDTGMGIERIAAVLQGVHSNYDTDAFTGLIDLVSRISDTPYGASDAERDVAMRVIADHARSSAFLIADGVMPSNEGRGYVLRRIMRRAIRFGVKLDLTDAFFERITDRVLEDFASVDPTLAERRAFVGEVVRAEERRFRATLDRGLRLLDDELNRAGDVLAGDVAFTLSDTYGFPLDLTRLIAEERGITVDEAGFEHALEAQRSRGRAAWKGSGEAAVQGLWPAIAEAHGETRFDGYPQPGHLAIRGDGEIIALVRTDGDDAERVERLGVGDRGTIVLDRTPFYGESGGQVGDVGQLLAGDARFRVTDTTKAAGLHLHHGTVESGALSVGNAVQAQVQGDLRAGTRRNHTATHLLHAALREVLGTHVTQKGSLVAPDRLRFDFSHHKPVNHAELRAIEDLVNREVLRNTALHAEVKPLEQARAEGAMALFGEKYDDEVRVVSIPGFSTELCGGTHVDRTGDIGPFFVTSESGVAAGVRRIEAQTGAGALGVARRWSETVSTVAQRLKTGEEQVPDAVERLQQERKRLEKALQKVQAELASAAAGDLADDAEEIEGVKVLAARYDGDLKEGADRLREQLGTCLVVLARHKGPKAILCVATTKDLAGSRVHAGKLVKELARHIGGGGGGRPDMAQAGGNNPAGIDDALDAARAWARAHLTR